MSTTGRVDELERTVREAMDVLYNYTSDLANPPGEGRSQWRSDGWEAARELAVIARDGQRASEALYPFTHWDFAAAPHLDGDLRALPADIIETLIGQVERARDALSLPAEGGGAPTERPSGPAEEE